MEAHDSFLEAGGEQFTYIPCLNDDDSHTAFLTVLIDNELSGWR
jgi:ferrochelatase